MKQCRSCGNALKVDLIDLGVQPPSNSFISSPNQTLPLFPLRAMVCEICYLVQLSEVVDPSSIFDDDYAYFSSYSKSWLSHSENFTKEMISRFNITPSSLVIEIASNDGYLLKNFVEAGVNVLGVDPASGCAKVAELKGVQTEIAFFGSKTAIDLKSRGMLADLIVANNVLAHVPDIHDFISGFVHILKDQGVLTLEFPHILNLLRKKQFDTIYHEHYSYLSLDVVECLFARHGLKVFDVEELPTHGGSLRVFGCKAEASFEDFSGLAKVRNLEANNKLKRVATYKEFSDKCESIRSNFVNFLKTVKREEKTVMGYGAAAKASTLLNYCNLSRSMLPAICDANPAKHHKFMPGSKIPIFPVSDISEARPDYLVIFLGTLKTKFPINSIT